MVIVRAGYPPGLRGRWSVSRGMLNQVHLTLL